MSVDEPVWTPGPTLMTATPTARWSSGRCGRCWTARSLKTAATELRQHLEQCPACLRHYGVEERIKKLIATKCSGERAPSYLVERVRMEISRTTIIRRG